MGINKDNYKLLLTQMLEGKLNPELEAELWAFLDSHPELLPDDFDVDGLKLSPERCVFNGKELLKKEPFQKHGVDNELAYLCVAEMEGNLTPPEKQNLDMLANEDPMVSRERSLYSQINLEPDLSVSFPQKSSLKRRAIQPHSTPMHRWAYIAAAAVALLIGSYSIIILNEPSTIEQPLLVEAEPVEPIETILPEPDVVISQPAGVQGMIIAEQGMDKIDAQDISDVDELIVEDNGSMYDIPQPVKPIQLNQIAYSPTTQVKPFRDYGKYSIEPILEDDEYIQPPMGGQKRTLGLFELAQRGINRVGEYTGRNLSLTADADPYGNITRIHFESSLFAVSTPVRREE